MGHRVMVPCAAGFSTSGATERLARELKSGDRVFCGCRPQQVKIVQNEASVELAEIRFNPDDPVQGLPLPQWGILTKGARMDWVKGPQGLCHVDPFHGEHCSRRRSRSI